MNINKSKEAIDALLTFLEPLNAYDREETMSIICKDVNPESRASIRKILDERYFLDQWHSKTPEAIKVSLATTLVSAFINDFDFEWLIHEADGTFQPPETLMPADARLIYEEVYRGVYDHWRLQLTESGTSIPAPVELGIPSSL